MSCGAGQITRSVRVAEGRGGRNAMKSDEPLGKVQCFANTIAPKTGGRAHALGGVIDKLIRIGHLTPSTLSPPLPSREEEYFLRSIGFTAGLTSFVPRLPSSIAGFAPLRRTFIEGGERSWAACSEISFSPYAMTNAFSMDASQRVGSIRPLHPLRTH